MNHRTMPYRFLCSLLIFATATLQNSAMAHPPGQLSQAIETANENLLSGHWSGDWVSCKTGHNGRLRATFCRISPTKVQAKFTGSFAKIFPFRYNAVLEIVHEEEGLIQLRGSRKLGPLMGTFNYEATLTENQFKATYRSKRDCGQWNMKRQACGDN